MANNATGRWVYVIFQDSGSKSYVHETFVKGLGTQAYDSKKNYEVFWCSNKKTTPEMLLKKQGAVHNIDQLKAKYPEGSEHRKLYEKQAGYYWGKICHEEGSHEAMLAWIKSPEARKIIAKACASSEKVPVQPKRKEANRDLIVQEGDRESKRKLLEENALQNKRTRPDPLDFENDGFALDATALGLMSSVSVEDRLSSLKAEYSGILRKYKEESQAKYSELFKKYEQLQLEYDIVANRETSEAFNDMHSNFTKLEVTLSKSREEKNALTTKYQALEIEHSNLKVEHADLKNQFTLTHGNLIKVIEKNLEFQSMLTSNVSGFSTASNFHAPSVTPSSRSRCSSASSSISLATSPSISCSSSPSLSVLHSPPLVDNQENLELPNSEQLLPFSQNTASLSPNIPNNPHNHLPVEPPPNVNLFDVEYDSYNPIGELEIDNMIATCAKGVDGDTKLVQLILIRVLAGTRDGLQQVSWAGRGATKGIKKTKVEPRMRFFLQKSVKKKILKENPGELPKDFEKRLDMYPLVKKAVDTRKTVLQNY